MPVGSRFIGARADLARRLSLNDLRAERSELNILRACTGPLPAIKSSSPTMDVMRNRRPGWATMPVPADDGHGPAGQPHAAATSSATPRAPAGPDPSGPWPARRPPAVRCGVCCCPVKTMTTAYAEVEHAHAAPGRGAVRAVLPLRDPADAESIFVARLRGHRYRCLSIPFWAYNLSLDDIIECRPDDDGEGLLVERVLGKSGNRTVRVGFTGPQRARHPETQHFRAWLDEHRFGYELAPPNLFAVNIPTPAAYQQVTERLRQIPPGADMIWEDGDPQPGVALDGSDT